MLEGDDFGLDGSAESLAPFVEGVVSVDVVGVDVWWCEGEFGLPAEGVLVLVGAVVAWFVGCAGPGGVALVALQLGVGAVGGADGFAGAVEGWRLVFVA